MSNHSCLDMNICPLSFCICVLFSCMSSLPQFAFPIIVAIIWEISLSLISLSCFFMRLIFCASFLFSTSCIITPCHVCKIVTLWFIYCYYSIISNPQRSHGTVLIHTIIETATNHGTTISKCWWWYIHCCSTSNICKKWQERKFHFVKPSSNSKLWSSKVWLYCWIHSGKLTNRIGFENYRTFQGVQHFIWFINTHFVMCVYMNKVWKSISHQ